MVWGEWSEPSILVGRVYAFDTAIMHANLMALRIMDLNLCQISYAHPSVHPSGDGKRYKNETAQNAMPKITQYRNPIESKPLFNILWTNLLYRDRVE